MLKCPNCTNEKFDGVDTSQPFRCPKCKCMIDPAKKEVEILTELPPAVRSWVSAEQKSKASGGGMGSEEPIPARGGQLRFGSDGHGGVRVEGCEGAPETLSIPDQWAGRPVTEIREYAFERRGSIKRVILPEGLLVIGQKAFAECRNLASVKIVGRLERIEENAFYRCTELTSFDCPQKPYYTSPSAFAGCVNLPPEVFDRLCGTADLS